jgi:hypothetical protein
LSGKTAAGWSASFTIRTPAGRDAQLEKAVEILKAELNQRGIK